MIQIIESIPKIVLNFLIYPTENPWYIGVRIGFFVLSLAMFIVIAFTFLKSTWFRAYFLQNAVEILTFKPFGARKVEKDWQKILMKLDSGLESEYKLAVIEADNMINDTLKKMGYKGDTLGERLSELSVASIPNIEDVKKAHQARNNIVHDPNYQLSLEEAKKALSYFEEAFKDLDAF